MVNHAGWHKNNITEFLSQYMPMVVEQNTYRLFQRYLEKVKLFKYSYNNIPE